MCAHEYSPLAYARIGNFEKALSEADLLIDMSSKVTNKYVDKSSKAHSYAVRCEVFSRKGVHDKALMDCETALKLLPENSSILASKAAALIRAGRFDEGISLFDITAKKEKISPQYILFIKAEVLDQVGRNKEALLAYKEILSINERAEQAQQNEKVARAITGGVLGYLSAQRKFVLPHSMLDFVQLRITELDKSN